MIRIARANRLALSVCGAASKTHIAVQVDFYRSTESRSAAGRFKDLSGPLVGEGLLQPGSLGEIYAKPVPAPLISSRHFRGTVTELFLDVAFVNLGGRGQTSP
jgi:hypothetical protein